MPSNKREQNHDIAIQNQMSSLVKASNASTWLAMLLVLVFFCVSRAISQSGSELQSIANPPQVVLITSAIDDSNLVTLAGNTRPEANPKNDRGRVPDSLPLGHMTLLLRRSPQREKALKQFIDQQHDPGSVNFHQWLNARQFGQKYGVSQADFNAITGWLKSHGFQVNTTYANKIEIDFSGTAEQVREAFHTEIHSLRVGAEKHIANMSDPKIPAALAPAVAGIVSLHDFKPKPMYKLHPDYTFGCGGANCYNLVPADIATIYNLNSLFTEGYSGQGQTIVLVSESDLYSNQDVDTYRSTFGITAGFPMGSFTTTHPGGCADPGVNGAAIEATLDVEMASASAPSATLQLAACQDTSTNLGIFVALQNLVNSTPPPTIVSMSYGEAETIIGATFNAFVNSLYQQAASEGVSVFVSSGDSAADTADHNCPQPVTLNGSKVCPALAGINVNGFGSTVYNVSVGGTDFGDTYAKTNSTYWNSTNGSTDGSALSYVPEIPWNGTCGSELIAEFNGIATTYGANGLCNNSQATSLVTATGGSGGPSGCATGAPATGAQPGAVTGTCAGYPKPSWQTVYGNPTDGVRDLPDVSLFAAIGVWGHAYTICYSDTANNGAACSSAPSNWTSIGGTSASSPLMAGIQALVNQATGKSWGNPNPTYYSIAASEYGATGNSSCNSTLGNAIGNSCVFHDVTQGDNDIPCFTSPTDNVAYNCYFGDGQIGVLSTSNSAYEPAYATQPGWDFATGIGTVNAYNLVHAFPASGLQATTTTVTISPTSVVFQANTNVTVTATVKPNTGTGTPTGTVTFYNGTTQIGQAALSNGVASFQYNPSSLAVGTYPINAAYGGDTTTFDPSTSAPVTLTVASTNLAATTTTESVSPTALQAGSSGPVTISATVTPFYVLGTPTGKLTFYNGTTQIGQATLSNGLASVQYNPSSLAVGAYPITTNYSGDGTFAPSTSATVTLTVTASSAQGLVILATFNESGGQPVSGMQPNGPLVLSQGNLYGTTAAGGSSCAGGYGCGTVFSVPATGGAVTVLHTFHEGPDGTDPVAALILAQDGNFYGSTTASGGPNGTGTGNIFKTDAAGNLTPFYQFCNQDTCSGATIYPSVLVQDSQGNFYGASQEGGTGSHCSTLPSIGCGSIFMITPAGVYSTLYSFCSLPNCQDGSTPMAGLILDAAGNLYGTTYGGGNADCPVDTYCGTVFKLSGTPPATLTTLHAFVESDGANPESPLVQDSAGNLYGTTLNGGDVNNCLIPQGCGVVFEITPAGTFSVLHTFELGEGNETHAGLVYANGTLYGTSEQGGTTQLCPLQYGCGTIFSIPSTGGTLSTLYNFTGHSDGNWPVQLMLANGILYGATQYGGNTTCNLNGGCGTIFSFGLSASGTTSTTTAVTVNPSTIQQGSKAGVTLSVTVSPTSGSGTPTGTVTFFNGTTQVGQQSLSAGTATLSYNTSGLAVGTFNITGSYGGDSNFAASTSSSAVLTVTSNSSLNPTSTVAAVTPSSMNLGATGGVTLSATVTPTSGSGTPTGTVTFFNGTTQVGQQSLSGGAATVSYNASALTAGSYSITASYGGDTNFAVSSSASVSLMVVDVTVAASQTTLNVPQGQAGQTSLTVTPAPLANFNPTVSFSCAGLPSQSTCSFSPATVSPNGAPVATTLAIQTAAASGCALRASSGSSTPSGRGNGLLYALLLPGLGILCSKRKRMMLNVRFLGLLATLALPMILWTACGSVVPTTPPPPPCGGTPKGTYTVNVTATTSGANPISKQVAITLNVQ